MRTGARYTPGRTIVETTGGGTIVASGLSKGQAAQGKAIIDERMARARSNAAPPVPPASVADELTKLAHLRDSGVLSVEQFEAAKARLLG